MRKQKGKTALDLARIARKRDTITLLKDADEVNRLALRAAIMHGEQDKAKALLMKGLNLDAVDQEASARGVLVPLFG